MRAVNSRSGLDPVPAQSSGKHLGSKRAIPARLEQIGCPGDGW